MVCIIVHTACTTLGHHGVEVQVLKAAVFLQMLNSCLWLPNTVSCASQPANAMTHNWLPPLDCVLHEIRQYVFCHTSSLIVAHNFAWRLQEAVLRKYGNSEGEVRIMQPRRLADFIEEFMRLL